MDSRFRGNDRGSVAGNRDESTGNKWLRLRNYMILLIKNYFIGTLLLACSIAPAFAQWPYEVPFVPSPQVVVDEMLRLADVKKDDFVFDLGSGDGRILISAAAKFGARGVGVDLDENLIYQSEAAAQAAGVAERVQFICQDLFKTDLARATVITMYLLPGVNMRLRPVLLGLKPGTRIVAHDFDLGDWKPDEKVTIPVPNKPYGPPRSDIMLWVVPADFSGTWTWKLPVGGAEASHEARFEQTFQRLDGRGSVATRQAAIGSPQISGDTVRFVMGAEIAGKSGWREFEGRINGDTITGTTAIVADGGKTLLKDTTVPWRATRTARGKWMTDSPSATFEPAAR